MLTHFLMLLAQAETESPPPVLGIDFGVMKPVLLLIGVAIFLIVYTRVRMQKRIRNNVITTTPVMPAHNKGLQPREMYDQLNALMAELVTLSRQINGQLDTRCARLNLLLQEADKKIAQYENLLRGNVPPRSAESVAPPQNHLFSPTDLPNNPNRPAAGPVGDIEPETTFSENAQHADILELAAKGLSPVAIAKTLDRPVGEVQLILSLNKKPK